MWRERVNQSFFKRKALEEEILEDWPTVLLQLSLSVRVGRWRCEGGEVEVGRGGMEGELVSCLCGL